MKYVLQKYKYFIIPQIENCERKTDKVVSFNYLNAYFNWIFNNKTPQLDHGSNFPKLLGPTKFYAMSQKWTLLKYDRKR